MPNVEKINLEDVFVTEGVPEYTFVPPPNYGDILLDIRRRKKPVIIEGQSGTGKTTTVRTIMQELGVDAGITYLTARNPIDLEKIERIARDRIAGNFVIDDFHRLPEAVRRDLADLAKLAAEMGDDSELPKLIIIGINQVGSDLIQLVGDIAKRTGIHRIIRGSESEISDLIQRGCSRLNVTIANSQYVFEESRGDYWLTQQICKTICSIAGVTETQVEPRAIEFNVNAVRSRMVSKLEAAYYPAVKEFCRGRRFRPSNDPYFKLLRVVGQQDKSVVDLNELANAIPDVRGSINNIKEHRLSVLIKSRDLVNKYFYYNNETKNFAIEDPALFYFLRHLDWARLRADCGFRERDNRVEWDVAISFAGENRELASYIAEKLIELDFNVFFDRLYEDNYLGRMWTAEFNRIFSTDSDCVICILDRFHNEKIWPTFERDCFSPRVVSGEVIPIFLDNTVFLGIPGGINGVRFSWNPDDPDWRLKVDEQIIFRLIDRLDS